MRARLRAWIEFLGDQFWLRPTLVVLGCIGLAQFAVWLETAHVAGHDASSPTANWGWAGGAEGARALLSAVASSTIGVAGTTFSITIAALTLASNQMGPRLLRNFVRDARNQIVLGIFLGTFAYALMVLRTVRTVEEEPFVPHLAVSGAVALALVCLGTLVWFVHHIATSINVETVVDAVHRDLCEAVQERTLDAAGLQRPPDTPQGSPVAAADGGYLQAIDTGSLAEWAQKAGVVLALRVRPGDYVPVGFPTAFLSAGVGGAGDAVARSLTFGRRPAALQDLEYSVRQLVEIAVRALSPSINDPMTAASVLDHLGDALCRIVPRHLPTGVIARDGRIVLLHPVTDYDGLCDAMFHMIRQNASGSVHVLARMLDVLARVAEVERLTDRLAVLRRHADLVISAARRDVNDPHDLADLVERHAKFVSVQTWNAAPTPEYIGDGTIPLRT
ncbi:DUF2254 domain-containing protein [Methylobacterium oxalidis]|uniref:Formate C-acetyltransferase glycine radical n=1 Tax=Methylobacterium oxalidis TaxID=944322 RepID=A0A512J935_9HYPH|nr:DUF2254 domain-containing protein [Methylobacterium oxalidis]GEP06480.1 hypothetical protein MOX02_45180 [Methylobacterium oxalidis]GJE33498.1 hypothetical protein LDDCCGHA_3698 [Methylobacterium oxalidis]GLS65520.1 hypothetical protein GCM10007888_39020 [Methylobacterium oxalidis]